MYKWGLICPKIQPKIYYLDQIPNMKVIKPVGIPDPMYSAPLLLEGNICFWIISGSREKCTLPNIFFPNRDVQMFGPKQERCFRYSMRLLAVPVRDYIRQAHLHQI